MNDLPRYRNVPLREKPWTIFGLGVVAGVCALLALQVIGDARYYGPIPKPVPIVGIYERQRAAIDQCLDLLMADHRLLQDYVRRNGT